MNDLIAFFDTETTGLPIYGEPSNHENQPHVTEIAYAIYTRDGRMVRASSQLIYPQMEVDPKVLELTGLSNELLHDEGDSEDIVIKSALREIMKCGERYAFNASFDDRILRIASFRFSGEEVANSLEKSSCVMQMAAKYLGLSKNTIKLKEAYALIIGKEITSHHSALADTLATAEIYFAINKSKGE